jgi:hypothetical protein
MNIFFLIIRGMNNPKNATYKNSRPSSIMNFTTIHDEPEDDDENEDDDTSVFFFVIKYIL